MLDCLTRNGLAASLATGRVPAAWTKMSFCVGRVAAAHWLVARSAYRTKIG